MGVILVALIYVLLVLFLVLLMMINRESFIIKVTSSTHSSYCRGRLCLNVMLVGWRRKTFLMYAKRVIFGSTRSVLCLRPSLQSLLITITLSILSSLFQMNIAISPDGATSAMTIFLYIPGCIIVTNAHILCIWNVLQPLHLHCKYPLLTCWFVCNSGHSCSSLSCLQYHHVLTNYNFLFTEMRLKPLAVTTTQIW